MKQWFDRFNTREQLSLLALGIALSLYVLYMAAWAPLERKRESMAARNQSAAVSLQRVDAMVSEVLALRASGEGSRARRNLTSVINRTTAAAGLSVSRLQPSSRGDIQVRFEGAEFSRLMAWLYDVEYGQSLLVQEVSITQSGSAGRVNATIRLGQGA